VEKGQTLTINLDVIKIHIVSSTKCILGVGLKILIFLNSDGESLWNATPGISTTMFS
jgi:hypothetical protein